MYTFKPHEVEPERVSLFREFCCKNVKITRIFQYQHYLQIYIAA